MAYAKRFATSLVGATVPLTSAADAAVTYQLYNDKAATDRDASSLGVALFYALSRRSTLYATASRLKNSNGGRFTLVDSGRNSYNFTPAAGTTVNPQGAAFGLRHVF